MKKMSWKEIEITDYAKLSINPLRKLKFEQTVKPNPDKKVITLQLGDPSVFGNFPPPVQVIKALEKSVVADTFPYNISHGREEARKAVAEYSKHLNVTSDDVILTSGCGHALEMCVLTLVAPGENLLIPRPCYNYKTWTDGLKIETRLYNLDPLKNWDIDLEHMESLIDGKTRAILVNSPGNPCGNVFSKNHIEEILEVAERHKLPIISDEVYEFFTFPGVEFHSFAALSKNVPVLTCSGLTKRFLVPGIRLGWIIIKDQNESLAQVRTGLLNVTTRILGTNSSVQLALPDILQKTPKSFFDDTMRRISEHAKIAYELLRKIEGLTPVEAKGAMYMISMIEMEKFPEFKNCLEFTEGLIAEESVLVFPGSPCFNFPGCFRIVLTVPEQNLVEACERIQNFCSRHIRL